MNEAPHDSRTIEYFDRHAPEYGAGRLDFAASAIRRLGDSRSSLLDVGCGAGNTLLYLQDATGITDTLGVDVSRNLLERSERRGIDTYMGSILDPALPDTIHRRFDFVVMAAVLHHLIGPTRAASKRYAQIAVANGLRMLEPNGHLIVVEPVWYPRIAMTGLFWIKQAVSRLTPRRVAFFGRWNNIGAPVVAYYTNEELLEMVSQRGPGEVIACQFDPSPLGRLNLVFNRTATTLVVRSLLGGRVAGRTPDQVIRD